MASKPQERPEIGIDVDAARTRLLNWKAETGHSWTSISQLLGIPHGTISSFGTNNYSGDTAKIASQIEKFFAAEARGRELRRGQVIAPPKFVQTRASQRLFRVLNYARLGNMTAAATSPGFGKSSAMAQYAEDTPNVWLCTMRPSTSGVQPMLTAILRVMGEGEMRGSPQMLSDRIIEKVRNSSGVIAVDEAQHLSFKALDELRSIHDETGVGIALFGNAALVETMEGGTRAVSHAQLFARLGIKVIHQKAYPEDGVALGQAWGISDPDLLRWLAALSELPGGLRNVSKTVQLAMFLALDEECDISLAHLKDAWAQLSARQRQI
jgi:DNA transposition AAA+ family ATPase